MSKEMTPAEQFKELKPQIDLVQEEEIISINMPFLHYMEECSKMMIRLMKYRDLLEAGGMDFSQVEKITSILGACRQANSVHNMVKFPNPESKVEWEKGKSEAEELLYDLKAAMDYAFHDHPELRGLVKFIREGGSISDMIQDLNDTSVLAIENKSLLEEVGYDMENARRAALLSNRLSELYAIATIDKSSTSENRFDRGKAFTLLKTTIDQLNRQARFITRQNKDLASEFTIRPPKRKTKKVKAEQTETVVA